MHLILLVIEIKCKNFLEDNLWLRILAIFTSPVLSVRVQNLEYVILVFLSNTGNAHFLKVCFTPPHFYERPTFIKVSVFAKETKSKEDFTFMKKGEKWK